MRFLHLFLFVFLQSLAFGQFGLISDADGFVNVRWAADIKSRIVDTLNNGSIVWCFESDVDWYPIDYQKGSNSNLSGYIHKSRVKLIEQFQKIPSIAVKQLNLVLKKDSISVIFDIEPFVAKNNRITFDGSFAIKINGKKIWGTDGEIPKWQYKKIEVLIGNDKIFLPKKAIENLYEPNNKNTESYYDSNTNTLYIIASNSDGAGGYAVLWVIERKKYKQRVITIPF